MPEGIYAGPVVFVDGVHYPVGEDGHADLSRPLRWYGSGQYRDADEGEPTHNETHGSTDVELAPGGEG